MVRIIAGTLLEVGKGNIEAKSLENRIAAADRSQAGPTAPGEGIEVN